MLLPSIAVWLWLSVAWPWLYILTPATTRKASGSHFLMTILFSRQLSRVGKSDEADWRIQAQEDYWKRLMETAGLRLLWGWA